ncbi:MAG: division/cell wall cluster transcriptional repressor MraZ [Treponema sp.]|jgi:MraZ protein|nr:division/cell wall cluster transcriptional repressor MraZ [Treponema sp.]
MALFSGDYPATLDDKGRISIPAKFRERIPQNLLVLTRGMIEHCVWAFTPEDWERVSSKIKNEVNLPARKADMLYHRLLFSTYEVEIDKAGRIAVPQKLRDFAGLTKDCSVTSDGSRIEIWDARRYQSYEQEIDEQLGDVLEETSLNMY